MINVEEFTKYIDENKNKYFIKNASFINLINFKKIKIQNNIKEEDIISIYFGIKILNILHKIQFYLLKNPNIDKKEFLYDGDIVKNEIKSLFYNELDLFIFNNEKLCNEEYFSKIAEFYRLEFLEKNISIQSIYIEELFGIKDNTFSYIFSKSLDNFNDLSIIFGKNGSGKSTIFKIVNLLLNNPLANFDYNQNSNIIDELAHFKKNFNAIENNPFKKFRLTFMNGLIIEIEKNKFDDSKSNLTKFYSKIYEYNNIFENFNEDYYCNIYNEIKKNLYDDNFLILKYTHLKRNIHRFKNIVTYISTDRFIHGNHESNDIYKTYNLFEAITNNKDFKSIIIEYNYFIKFLNVSCVRINDKEKEEFNNIFINTKCKFDNFIIDNTIKNNPDFDKRLRKFKTFDNKIKKINEIYMQDTDKKDFTYKQIVIDYSSSCDKMFKIKTNDKFISLKELSFGEYNYLQMLFSFVFKQTDRGVYIIDEPEISLNINWQLNLIDNLKTLNKTNNQILIITHSPFIANSFPDKISYAIYEKTK